MTSAEKKIILEHGSDYVLRMKIMADDGINNRDMSNWTWKFEVYDGSGDKLDANTVTGTFDANTDTENGDVQILIDSAKIDAIDTAVTGDDAFATQYNYYYTLTVTDDTSNTSDNRRDMRLLRGRLAVRL